MDRFSLDEAENMEYLETRQFKRPSNEHGYMKPSFGDSGSPYMAKDHINSDDPPELHRYTLAGVHNSGWAGGHYTDHNCSSFATELNGRMVNWLLSNTHDIVLPP